MDVCALLKAINHYLLCNAAAELQQFFCLKLKMRTNIAYGAKEVGDKEIVWEMDWYNGGGRGGDFESTLINPQTCLRAARTIRLLFICSLRLRIVN